jgi:hypothetical protein
MADRPDELAAPLRPADLAELDFEAAVERRTAIGGTARAAVQAQLARARDLMEASR